MPNPKKPRTSCFNCGKEPARPVYKYCSNTCQQEYQFQNCIQAWKKGAITGLNAMGIVSSPVKRYLREKFHNRCCLCGWAEVNPVTNIIPLVADHIDGNWRNNHERNLRLLCPNCDSLTPTFSALNKGKGRNNRAISKRTVEARILIRQKRSLSGKM